MKQRGFELVAEEHVSGREGKGILPVRADTQSAGYDFYMPNNRRIRAGEEVWIKTNIKAYMLQDEVLQLYIRSSYGINLGLTLKNGTGIIDASYYENQSNDGNITAVIVNNTDKDVHLKHSHRFMQGVFQKYLITDDDAPTSNIRTGGTGSSGR